MSGRGRAWTLPGLRPWHQPASSDALTHHVRPHVAAIDHLVAGRGTAPAGLGKPGCPSPPSPPPRRKVTPVPGKKGPTPAPKPLTPRFAPLPPQPMICSRAAASRAPAAPAARGASRPLTQPPARRNRQRSGQGSTLKHAPKRKTAHHRTHLRSRGDAGKRTASGPKERSAEPLALPIRARFIPLHGRPDCTPDWGMPRIPGRPVLRRSARAARRAGLVRTRGRGGQPDQPAPSHRGRHGGGDRVRAARRVEDWHGAVASDTAPSTAGLDSARAASACRKGSRCPLRD